MNKAPNIAPVSETRISQITDITGQDTKAARDMVKRGTKITEAVNNATNSPPRR